MFDLGLSISPDRKVIFPSVISSLNESIDERPDILGLI
jgi:hypothetical protein